MSEYLLEMKNISKGFYGVQVLEDITLQVNAGEVHVLIGENGAGKSTLMKILSGAYKLETGEILIDGQKVSIHSPKDAIDKGISIIYQEFNLNPYTSIYENLFLGKELGKGGLVDHQKMIAEAKPYLERIGLEADPRTLVENLTVAQQQMLEIAKALAANTKILILDEPTAAITHKETEKLFNIIRELKASGIGIIYISHRLKELFEIGDRCTVLRDGRAIATKELSGLDVDQLTYLMVGHEVDMSKADNPFVSDEIMLEVENISYKNSVREASFDLKKGEILGFSGLVGSGRSELAKCIIGAFHRDSGTIRLQGQELGNRSVKESIRNRIVYLSEDRKREGLILMHSVKQNIELPNLDMFGKIFLSGKRILDTTKESIRRVRVKTTGPDQEVQRLSGGNQQKVVIAKWLLQDAKVYIFDEPTRGIDVGARDEIYQIMYSLIEKGNSIIMISSDLQEIMKMSDRIVVMREGRIVSVLNNDGTITQEDVLHQAFLGGES